MAADMTSPAVRLARELCICAVVDGCIVPAMPSEGLFSRQLETFYTKAQAQALRDAAKKFRGEIGYNFVAADGYSNAFDVASELEYMADELEAGK